MEMSRSHNLKGEALQDRHQMPTAGCSHLLTSLHLKVPLAGFIAMELG